MKVFVLSTDKRPLMPTTPARARQLLKGRRAVIHRHEPFTIRLKDRDSYESTVQPIQLKIDPGSRTSGIAIVRKDPGKDTALHLAELHHRINIPQKLQERRLNRSNRRSRKTRYRPCRPYYPTQWIKNKRRKTKKPNFKVHSYRHQIPKGWLPPSQRSRIDNIANWVDRYRRWLPITAISVEKVRFDTQLLENPEISGIEYQQGELHGYEVREYLLEKWGRKCAYCGAKDVRLYMEHIIPKSRGGTNRVSNLTIACKPCNDAKGSQTAAEYSYPKLQAKAKLPLKGAAALNSTRFAIYERLQATRLPVEASTGGMTKFNRMRFNIPKSHALDALCVGEITADEIAGIEDAGLLVITAKGRGTYQRAIIDKYGFPKTHRSRNKIIEGFKTGDRVRLKKPGMHAGTYIGHVIVRESRSFRMIMRDGLDLNASYKFFQRLQYGDGYEYFRFHRFNDSLQKEEQVAS